MASVELSRRVEKVVGYPPLRELDADQRSEFHEALLDADSFEGVLGEGQSWSAAFSLAAPNTACVNRMGASCSRASTRAGGGAYLGATMAVVLSPPDHAWESPESDQDLAELGRRRRAWSANDEPRLHRRLHRTRANPLVKRSSS